MFFIYSRYHYLNLLSDIWFTNTFSLYVNCLFTFLTLPFEIYTYLILMKTKHLFFFILPLTLLVCYLKKSLKVSEIYVFFSYSFIVKPLIFRYVIHTEFIFVYDVRERSSLLFLHIHIQLFQYYLLENYCSFI